MPRAPFFDMRSRSTMAQRRTFRRRQRRARRRFIRAALPVIMRYFAVHLPVVVNVHRRYDTDNWVD